MAISKESIIGELVAQDYRVASVFKKHHIDFCCNGARSIQEACDTQNINVDALITQLNEAGTSRDASGTDFQSWPLDLLADYVEKKHHRYVEAKIQEITPFLEKIVCVHGERHPELLEVAQLFQESAADLTAHMSKEEGILFPHIRKMVAAQQNGTVAEAPFGTVQNPIKVMMSEHDNEGERFRKIAELTNDYTPPEDACNTYRVTFAMIQEFEDDLHLHIHLENNILFPKAIKMEEAAIA